MTYRGAKWFDWVTKLSVIVSGAVFVLVTLDALVGFGLNAAMPEVAVALFILIIAMIIRAVGLWFMRTTGAVD